MNMMQLKPWPEVVTLHPDVEVGGLPEATFAVDLGAIASRDPNLPAVSRDPEAFFRATYLTADLKRLLHEVLGSLAGETGYNRVLKLRTPFGGGNSHTLAALLHAARDRQALSMLPEAAGLPNPGDVAVAVFDGEKLDAHTGKTVAGEQVIRTLWGWLAWQIDPEKAYPIVAGQDRDRVAPGGDQIAQMLTEGASGRPVLLLLDEVLKYMERAGAVLLGDSTLQRQAKDFFQNLTVEVARSKNAALVYSLQWSAREALGNTALLGELEHLSDRVDELREPVQGDEVLMVLQRRLLGTTPDGASADAVAGAFAEVVTGMKTADAETPVERHHAQEEGEAFRARLRQAYPFHPALVDLMRERWTGLPAFQRTRGALRLLGECLHAVKHGSGAGRALLGPADVPLDSSEVRLKLLKELGAQNAYDGVISADIVGPQARAKRIDDRLAKVTPALSSVKPAARLATAIFLYSFGGLQRAGADGNEPLPAGVSESELLSACVGPDLDSITAKSVLSDLAKACLFLHYDGVRYCFKTDPNVTKLMEDAAEDIARQEASDPENGPVRTRVKDLLVERLAGHPGALVWPPTSQDTPDREPRFLVAYLPLEFATLGSSEQTQEAVQLLGNFGDRPRQYRNGVALAVPDKTELEALRRSVRLLLAIDRVDAQKSRLNLTKDQLEQLKENKRTEGAAVEATFRKLYPSVWLPRVEEGGQLGIEKLDGGSRALKETGVHERVMELLAVAGTSRVYTTLVPGKIVERLRLGEAALEGQPPRSGVSLGDVRDAFFAFLDPPRLESDMAIRAAVVQGVHDRRFAYTSGAAPELGSGGKYQVNRDRVSFGVRIADDEVDFDSGSIMLPGAVPDPEGPPEPVPDLELVSPAVPPSPAVVPSPKLNLRLSFRATRDQVFKAFPAIANLADRSDSGTVRITVESEAKEPLDPVWLRNAVHEPLDEADIEVDEQ